MVIVIVIMVSCVVLVGISYLMLNILSGMVVTPRTPVREVAAAEELVIPIEGSELLYMQVSGDGRYIALVEATGGGKNSLRVFELSGERSTVLSREVESEEVAWLGDAPSLVYADGGDVHVLEVETGASENLTAGPEYDTEPIPSPDGRYVLWTAYPEGPETGAGDVWVMDCDGSDKAYLAPRQDLMTWDPAGGTVISRRATAISEVYDSYRYFLEAAVPGREGWDYLVECEGEVLYIWWPERDTVLYISIESAKGQEELRGVWYRVEQPDRLKKTASTDGFGRDADTYTFYPARGMECLAYVGEYGLEYLDYGERIIYRYRDLEAGPPLAWNESGAEIYYSGPEGVYVVDLGGK